MFEPNGDSLRRIWRMLNGHDDVPAQSSDADESHKPLFNKKALSTASEQADPDHEYADLTGQIQLLGEEPVYDGSYSKVYKGDLNGKLVAVKVLKYIPGKSDAAMERKMEREMSFWAKNEDYRIVKFLGHARGPKLGTLGAFISPWYANGDSRTYLETRKDTLTFWNRIDLFWNAACGILFLHKKGIVHGDIKPGNVLIAGNGLPRICDFGLATILLDAPSIGLTTTSEFTGTPRYLSPELLTSDSTPPTTASDVWALGCLGLEYMFGVIPYAHRPNNNRGVIYQDIKSGRLPYEKSDRQGLDDAVQELLHICWHRDHTRRPQLGDIVRLAGLLQGRGNSFPLGMGLNPSRVEVYEMAYLMRYVNEKRSTEVPFFVRSSPTSLPQPDGWFSQQEAWRQWALYQVLDFALTNGEGWNVRELYTGSIGVLLDPNDARIVTPAGIVREYEAMRSRGEGPFPILPVNEWPPHGEGSILRPEWSVFLRDE